jgi:hypothetical protein
MSFTTLEEKQILAHLSNTGNPHKLTKTSIGLNSTDDLREGDVNKFTQLYTLPPEIKQILIDQGHSLPDSTSNMSVGETFNLIFNLIIGLR